VVETDIASCFSAIPHDKLMEAVEERICDQPVLKLLRAMLRAGVMEDGRVRRETAGTPQGGVFSPVMCNLYLHRLDRAWDDRGGVLCRYADDLVVMCWSRSQAEAALERLTALLAGLGLEPKAAKTRRAPGGGRRGGRFPRFPPPAGARAGAEREQAGHVPCQMARGQGNAARPRPDQGTD
jgi:RNA-directed DNA polymerase